MCQNQYLVVRFELRHKGAHFSTAKYLKIVRIQNREQMGLAISPFHLLHRTNLNPEGCALRDID